MTKPKVPSRGTARAVRAPRADPRRRAVSELDRLDLVILEQPGDRLRLRYGDLVQWLPRGPLLEHLYKHWGRGVLDRARASGSSALLRLHQLALRPDTRAELESELGRVLDTFLRRARAEQLTSSANEAPPHGVLVALSKGSLSGDALRAERSAAS
jgi:hypothetical protein